MSQAGADRPTETVERLIAALSDGALDTVMSFYAQNATFLPEPRSPVAGTDAIREAMQGFIESLQPKLNIEESTEFTLGDGDVACVVAKWSGTGTGPDGNQVELAGKSANVLTRESDGRWIVLLDNPWGTDLFDESGT